MLQAHTDWRFAATRLWATHRSVVFSICGSAGVLVLFYCPRCTSRLEQGFGNWVVEIQWNHGWYLPNMLGTDFPIHFLLVWFNFLICFSLNIHWDWNYDMTKWRKMLLVYRKYLLHDTDQKVFRDECPQTYQQLHIFHIQL